MAGFVYPNGLSKMTDGTIDWVSGVTVIKVMLLDSGHTPDPDETAVTNLATDELSGTGYAAGFGGAGRKVIGLMTNVFDSANDRTELSGAGVTWTGINAGIISYVAVIWEDTNDAGSVPLAIFDSNEITNLPLTTNGGDVTITWNAEGIIQIS